MKYNFKSIIGFSISFICLYIVYQSFNWNQFLIELKNINYFYLLLSVVCLAITILFRGLRWKYLFTTSSVNFFHLSKETIRATNFKIKL